MYFIYYSFQHCQYILPKGDIGPNRHLPTKQALLTKVDTNKGPSTHNHAKKNRERELTMVIKYESLIKNQQWKLVTLINNKNIVRCKWVFKTKYGVDGQIDK